MLLVAGDGGGSIGFSFWIYGSCMCVKYLNVGELATFHYAASNVESVALLYLLVYLMCFTK